MRSDSHEFDVVVVGSGGAGMTAALKAGLDGLSVVVIEKTSTYGGTTAVSGGVVWIPNSMYLHQLTANWYLPRVGLADSEDKGIAYLEQAVGDRVPAARREMYVRQGHRMIRELHDRCNITWRHLPWPDYYAEGPGGNAIGRGLESEVFDARKLGAERAHLRPPVSSFALPVAATTKEALGLSWGFAGIRGPISAAAILARAVREKATGAEFLTNGQAMIGQMRLAMLELQIPLWLSTPFLGLVAENGPDSRVTGVRVQRGGAEVEIRARRGVVLATGGFSRSQEMREKYLPSPTRAEWTLVPEDGGGALGDGHLAGLELGAAVDLMDKCWGFPCLMVPNKAGVMEPVFALFERNKPGATVVNGAGERYFDDGMSYEDMWNKMYSVDSPQARTVPSWVIFDQKAKNKYAFFGIPPRIPFPKRWLESGNLHKAGSIAELATKMGVPVDKLTATVRRYNGMARNGVDEDFHKGETALTRFLGDPSSAHPNLGPIENGPFYAAQLIPSELATKGGLLVNEHSQVLREDNSIIEGLYATGNCSASTMGSIYPGPGGTIGPAMVSGWVAAKHLLSLAPSEPRPAAAAAR